jgi:hypothetical protein
MSLLITRGLDLNVDNANSIILGKMLVLKGTVCKYSQTSTFSNGENQSLPINFNVLSARIVAT